MGVQQPGRMANSRLVCSTSRSPGGPVQLPIRVPQLGGNGRFHPELGRRSQLGKRPVGVDWESPAEATFRKRCSSNRTAAFIRNDVDAATSRALSSVSGAAVGTCRLRDSGTFGSVRASHTRTSAQPIMASAGAPHPAASRRAIITQHDHRAGGRLSSRQLRAPGRHLAFPAQGSRGFSQALGAREFATFIGPLIMAGTQRGYDAKVHDWYAYNEAAGYHPHEVCDAKVFCFGGWLSSRSKNRDFNSWTSGLNGHFDELFGCRPFNSHRITQYKKVFKRKQLERTMSQLPAGALEPAEARMALPATGFAIIEDSCAHVRNNDDKLCRFLLMLVSVLFILRPATVWAFQPGDVCCVQIPNGVAIVCISRSVKRRPELLSAPNRREIVVYDDDIDSPLGRIATAILRVQHVRWDWCCQVSREAGLQKDGSAVLTRWLREAVGNNLRLPPGRRLSSYSLRIMGASAASAAGRDINWIRLWGLWKTPLQVYTYIQDDYGHSEYATSLFSFGKPRSGGADYVRGRDPAPRRQLEQSAAAGTRPTRWIPRRTR